MTYYIIPKSLGRTGLVNTSSAVGAYLLARRVSNYFIIKSDNQGDRLVDLNGVTDVNLIIKILDES